MPKMISDPEDKNPGKGYKPEKLGSAIRVDGKPLKDEAPVRTKSVGSEAEAPNFRRLFDRAESSRSSMPRVNEMGDAYKKGGKVGSASKRADGIAQKGKTRGTMIMCGGGMARGKK